MVFMSKLRRAVHALVAVSLLAGASARAGRPYRGGAVATAYPPASEAALLMLKMGGNAVDAAVAAAFVAGVAGPYHNGIGGGGFALLYDAKAKKTEAFDFREVAPLGASHDMYLKDGQPAAELSRDGATSVAVPGAVKGYLEMLKKHGTLSPSVVLAPAIALARTGIWVTPKYQSMARLRVPCLAADADAARLFLRPNPKGVLDVPEIGTVLKNPELARTLMKIAAQGASAFYSGPIARAIADTVQRGGGVLSEKDLAAYKTRTYTPLEGQYRGYRIAAMPPPSAGGLTVLEVLGQLETLLPKGYSRADPEAVHVYAEAVRRSYVDRAKYLGDPAFVTIPLGELNSKAHFEALAKSIDPQHATDSKTLLQIPAEAPKPQGTGALPAKNTTHLSVIDKDGNAVALTTTINYAFGSCRVAKGTGILLNDAMDDFAAKPLTPNAYGLITGEANAVAPGKVPSSSMSPTLVFQKDAPDEVMLAVGSPGGSTIPTTVIQVIENIIDHQMDLTRAVAAGRVHHQYLPDVLVVEKLGLEPATQRALEARGHRLQSVEALGDAEAVYVNPVTHLRYSASDPRGEGLALGQE